MKIAPLRWPACNAGYDGPLPRPMILDTNVVLDMLIFDDRISPPSASWSPVASALDCRRSPAHRAGSRAALQPDCAARQLLRQDARRRDGRFDAAVEYVSAAPKIRFTCTDPDDQHFLDLASQHKALLVSKDRAVLKQRKRVATHYGATVGNVVVMEEERLAA
jgi:predicted nucleic acid-binding protein